MFQIRLMKTLRFSDDTYLTANFILCVWVKNSNKSETVVSQCDEHVSLIFFECLKIRCNSVLVIKLMIGIRLAVYKVSDYTHRIKTTALRI
ncbi:hypothetical protein JCM19376_21180 [Fusibacter bizertensis]